jgi:hypothetical protein
MQGAMNNFNFSNINEILSDSVFLEDREYPSNLRPFNVPFPISKNLQLKDSELESQVSEDTKESKKKIEELLRCFICYGKVRDPIMCPSCSKFCCNGCFKKWLTEHKSECPYCRDHLRVAQ